MSSENPFLEKVKQYEPILVFGKNEHFFPADVANYVAHSSLHLWRGPQFDKEHVMRVPRGELTLADLAKYSDPDHFLVYADDQFWDEDLVEALQRLGQEFNGYENIPMQRLVAEVLDTGYEGNAEQPIWKRILKLNSLLDFAGIATRGDLPRKIYDQALASYGNLEVNPPTYYYRIHEADRSLDTIQYWFFYPYNDWATSHLGVNDHEADWESIFIFFKDIHADDPPMGMVYSAHSSKLLRPWKAVKREGDHPIVHVAPGSHASYPPSDFANLLLAMAWRPFSALPQLLYRIIEAWRRGGETIGPGGHPWEGRHDLTAPENIAWVGGYKGRWGARYEVDMPFKAPRQAKPGGSPGGPMWDKHGEPRLKWTAPYRWVGKKF